MVQSINHLRFFDMLDRVPRIDHLWDRERRRLKVELFERELGVMSSGEVCMAQFFASVWFHSNERYGFDLAYATARIDRAWRELICEWLADPFWP